MLAPHPRTLLKLAYLERTLGSLSDAEAHCTRALNKEPDLAEAHVLMGRILTDENRLEEAEIYWSRAIELDANLGLLRLDKALSLASIGRFDDAIEELQLSIEAAPHQGAAYKALVFAKRITPDDLPLVRQMEELLASPALPDAERLNLLYSLGKSFDNLADYERAIGYFDKANALKLALTTRPFDRNEFKSLVEDRIRVFTKERLSETAPGQSSSDLPILIVGMMRSGTTLAEQVLSCHRDVGGAGEQPYWAYSDGSIVNYAESTINASTLNSCSQQYMDLLRSVAPGFERVIDKNPANLLVLGSFHLAFPKAKIIHTRRNAMDTALSIWMTPTNTEAGFVCDRENIVFAYRQYLLLMEHWRQVLPADCFLEIQYEDLISDPEVKAKEIVEFCGLEWDEACLHPERNQRRINTPSFWQVRQPIYKTSTKRWKNYEPWLGAFEDLRDL